MHNNVCFFTFSAIVIFCSCVLLMTVISFFTKPVPLDELGALTWPTINKFKAKVTAKKVVPMESKGTNTRRPSGIRGEGNS